MTPHFIACFSDGSYIRQDPENDISILDPAKSRYWDVLSKVETVTLSRFEIATLTGTWGVDLKTGMFYIRNMANTNFFKVEPSMSPMHIDGPFELIYFKDHTVSLALPEGKSDYITKYRIGWKCGKFYQTIIVG